MSLPSVFAQFPVTIFSALRLVGSISVPNLGGIKLPALGTEYFLCITRILTVISFRNTNTINNKL